LKVFEFSNVFAWEGLAPAGLLMLIMSWCWLSSYRPILPKPLILDQWELVFGVLFLGRMAAAK
jgi:hypothetical protein